jgi:hypothetical protein
MLNAMMKPMTTNIAARPVSAKIEVMGSKSYSAKERRKSSH